MNKTFFILQQVSWQDTAIDFSERYETYFGAHQTNRKCFVDHIWFAWDWTHPHYVSIAYNSITTSDSEILNLSTYEDHMLNMLLNLKT